MMQRATTILIIFFAFTFHQVNAQTASTSDYLVAQPITDRLVPFELSAPGISKTVEFGADLAWLNEQNFRRALLFMGSEQVDVARVSYQPTLPLVNGELQQPQMDDLNSRLFLVQSYASPDIEVVMNVDAPTISPFYYGNADNWRDIVKVTATLIEEAGYNVVSVGPMNEPDYSIHQGTIDDFYNIVESMRADSFFEDIRISGGNVLNCDLATDWYNYLKPSGVDEGNTHQLAGGFDSYANFFETVRVNGDHASNDELHNVMEALVGYEYGMQTGIWWGPADLARGEMVKAFDGERIGYAEHRPYWTAAAVYRTPEGKVQAFGGTSERQAVTTTYNYISKDRAVYYDGKGPQREFVLEMPGGTGYWEGQTNAERVINISWGEDVQPAINGRYKLVNRNSGLVMAVTGNNNGSNIQQGNYSGLNSQQWDVIPVDSRIGGDFSYYRFQPASSSTRSMDLYNFSLDDGANLNLWDSGNGGNQQWYLDYAGDGWFYIRSRESSKCVDVFGASTYPGGNVAQWEKNGGLNQQWRLLPVDAPIEFEAPSAPTNLSASAKEVSIQLDWTASPEADVTGYTIFRAETAAGPYNTIARDVTTTSFVDNTTLTGVTYYYAVKAADYSLNRSDYSNQVSATASGENTLVTHLTMEGNTQDITSHLNHSAPYEGVSYDQGPIDTKSIRLNGNDAFVQLPPDVANHAEITVATWVNWNGGGAWQRIFDFGNGPDESMFLTPRSQGGQMQFQITQNGVSNNLYAPILTPNQWTHVALTLGTSGIYLYVDGEQVAQSANTSLNLLDFKPVLNYIGRSQSPDPLLNGRIDDFRIYNYALTASEVSELANVTINSLEETQLAETIKVFPNPVNDLLTITTQTNKQALSAHISDVVGRTMLEADLTSQNNQLDVSSLQPGIYLLTIGSGAKMVSIQKLIKN